jgi:hypothetical protein
LGLCPRRRESQKTKKKWVSSWKRLLHRTNCRTGAMHKADELWAVVESPVRVPFSKLLGIL